MEFKYLESLVHKKKVASITEIRNGIGQATVTLTLLKFCMSTKTNTTIEAKMVLFQTLTHRSMDQRHGRF